VQKSVITASEILVNKRAQLEPVFNPEDSTELSILKGERGEALIEEFRENLVGLSIAIDALNKTATFRAQKKALVTLGFLGELLVKEFPYRVPSLGKFSYLPRLLGRCQVTLRMKRAGSFLGNVTIVADGYTAPLTAGNFIDLCLRNFYTGLPIKSITKRFGPPSGQVPTATNILGSFNEGFYDPLTAKLRCIPLEIIRFQKGSGKPKLSYSSRGLPDTSLSDMLDGDSMVLSTKTLLTFNTRGLVAMNHPDKDRNGGSAEFFGLTDTTLPEGTSKSLLDGEYAPFGFIITGYEVFCELKPDDVIDVVFVDDFGKQNLIKIRQSSFKEAAKGSEAALE
jgi:peptidylprolyl isomerase